ncbi:nucleotidyl transferase AbiEii/AbiGii toxin family protein [Rhizobium sp. SGZ-381]|uniref:nucleotidyl transferase AbiEii/AbiGii toxin family protein n=1 Tax=Rhizobium sp. SGZ-381 TaxID=3342800 RepID=UPI00366FE592
MTEFHRPEHMVIASLLRALDHDLLMDCRCWFGGGTAIVLTHGEYRRSLDVDFLCADRDGYRQLRSRFLEMKDGTLFPSTVTLLREPIADTYGIRTLLDYQGLVLKFEIVREGRVDLSGSRHGLLHVPTLSLDDMFTEKLLANADRCYDRAVAYRDAIDLGRLIRMHGTIPPVAREKAEDAYGADIGRKLRGIVHHLGQNPGEVAYAATTLDMDPAVALEAIAALRQEVDAHFRDAD